MTRSGGGRLQRSEDRQDAVRLSCLSPGFPNPVSSTASPWPLVLFSQDPRLGERSLAGRCEEASPATGTERWILKQRERKGLWGQTCGEKQEHSLGFLFRQGLTLPEAPASLFLSY